MLTFKIIRLVHLILYFVIAVQLCFYLYLMGDALKQISIQSFLEQRRIVHPLVSERHQWVYYAALILSVLMVIWSFRQGSTFTSITYCIAAVCILADVIIAVKGNGPLNTLIQEQSLISQTVDWVSVRDQWLRLINIRAVFILVGVVSLYAGLIFKK